MNPNEIHEYLTTLIRDGAGGIAAFVVGAALAAFITWKVGHWLRDKGLQQKAADLEVKYNVESELRRSAEQRAAVAEDRAKNATPVDSPSERELMGRYTQAVLDKEKLTRDRQSLALYVHRLKRAVETLEKSRAESAAVEAESRAIVDRMSRQHRDLRDRLRQAVEHCGRAWERPVSAGAAPFVPRSRRDCSILSMINLKGGVGKTTLTLNIAATLAGQGKRVLLVDLDHQRSLSHLCLRTKERNQVSKGGHALQHFLFDPANRTPEFFASCIEPVNGIDLCSVVINSDPSEGDAAIGLAGVEEFLWLQWVVGLDKAPDVRLFLREALHSPSICEQYDYVLLDCPPRLTTGTINAIAASDFLVIPVELDAIAGSNPTPHLLRELRRLRAPERFPHFSLLGIIANKVQMSGTRVLGDQKAVLDGLAKIGPENWGEKVPVFETLVNDVIAFSKAARVLVNETDSAAVVHADEKVEAIFLKLVEELKEKMADESKQLATVRS
jgi:cellulose biosynthesis protein BcsQ